MASGSTLYTLDRVLSLLEDKNDQDFTEIGGISSDSDGSILPSENTSEMVGIIGQSEEEPCFRDSILSPNEDFNGMVSFNINNCLK